MDTTRQREIISRRDRPSKPPLSRDVIAATALKILEQDGSGGLSLRKVASVLDTGPASLYVYFKNLQKLHAAMIDMALAEVKLPKKSGTHWRDRLKSILSSYLVVLYNKRGLAQLAMSSAAEGRNSLRIMECILGLLQEAGAENGKAAWGYDVLTLSVTAIAAEQSNKGTQEASSHPEDDLASAALMEEFPLIQAMREEFFSGDEASRLDWVLDVIINGVIKTPFPPPSAGAREMRKRLQLR